MTNSDSQTDREESKGSLFRKGAVKHYLAGREQEVLPQFISPKSFYLLWILFILLIVAAIAGAYLVQIPAYASGTAVFTKAEDEDPIVAAFVSPKYLEGMQKEQQVSVQLGSEERLRLTMSSVEPEALSPKETRKKFALDDAQVAALEGSTAAAVAPLKSETRKQDSKVYDAQVEVGSRRAVSLIPVVGDWLGKKSER